MAVTRPVTDLRDHFADVMRLAHETEEPMLLTGGDAGEMVLISRESFQKLLFHLEVDLKLQEAERVEEQTEVRYSFDDVYQSAVKIIRGD